MGLWPAIFFVFVILSLYGRGNNSGETQSNSIQSKFGNFALEENLGKSLHQSVVIDLEETIFSKYQLTIQYGKDKELKNNLPVSAWSYVSGFEGGTQWTPVNIIINHTNDDQEFEYEVTGILNWKLLGMDVLDQAKTWKGTVALK